MTRKTSLFLYLWIAGFVGVLTILLIDLNGLIAALPAHILPAETITFTPFLKVVSLIQPSLLLAIGVVVGVYLTPQVGLTAPVFEAFANGESVASKITPQILPGFIGGIVGGLAIVATSAIFIPLLPDGAADRISEFGRFVPLLMRLLYGGVTEEILLRWGFMTLLVWLGWRVFQKERSGPSSSMFVAAILLSSIMFGIGHLPIAFLLFPEPAPSLIGFVIVANSIFGLIAGTLYWKRGLESAMIAHVVAHLVLFTASKAGAYF